MIQPSFQKQNSCGDMEDNKRSTTTRILAHLGLWLISFIVLYRLFTIDYEGGRSDVIYTLLFHVPLLIVVYLNEAIYRRWGEKNPWLLAAGLVLLTLLGVVLHHLVFDFLSDYLAPGYYFISYFSHFQISQFVFAYLIISTLLMLSAMQFTLQRQKGLLERENQEVKLRSLKAQVNPHFLINSLNNIYAMTTSLDEGTRNYLVKLSDALRYMVYETEAEQVLLETEVKYLEDYISLERLRLEKSATIQFTKEGDYEGYLIAPLLLITFIENCFKHYAKEDAEIYISMRNSGGKLELKTKNNYDATRITSAGGLGLRNAKRRLNLIYPNKHELKTWQDGNYFYTQLKLDLS